MSYLNKNNNFYNSNTKRYLVGFVLSVILTIIPFSIVMIFPTSNLPVIITIIVTAVSQIIVHLICFLHLNIGSKSYKEWNIIAFIFTLIIITILTVGSIWIMWNLKYKLMNY